MSAAPFTPFRHCGACLGEAEEIRGCHCGALDSIENQRIQHNNVSAANAVILAFPIDDEETPTEPNARTLAARQAGEVDHQEEADERADYEEEQERRAHERADQERAKSAANLMDSSPTEEPDNYPVPVTRTKRAPADPLWSDSAGYRTPTPTAKK